MYLSDLRMYFKVEASVFQANLKWDGGVLNRRKISGLCQRYQR